MKLVILMTTDIAQVMDIATAWQEMGATGVTILEGYGLHRSKKQIGMRDDLPFFSSLSRLLRDRGVETHLLVSVVQDAVADRLHHETTCLLEELDASQNVIILTVDVTRISGLSISA